MCGIAFWSLAESGTEVPDASKLVAALLAQIESRGRDSAGVAWHESDRSVWTQKAPVTGRHLAADLAVPYNAPQGIIHTRFATQGDPKVNDNNHPIIRPGIVLVHNGHVRNDDEVFRTLKVDRIAQVDSEAIAASLTAGGTIDERLGRCRGGVATAWMRVEHDGPGNPPLIQAARCSSSPLCIGQTAAGDTIAASTQQLLVAACRSAGITLAYVQEVREWTYLTVRAGKIETYRSLIEPAWSLEPFSYRHYGQTLGGRTNLYAPPSRKAEDVPLSTQRTLSATGRHMSKAQRKRARRAAIAERERQERMAALSATDAAKLRTARWIADQHGDISTDADNLDTLGLPVDDLRDPFDDDDFAEEYARLFGGTDDVLDEEDLADIIEWAQYRRDRDLT